MRFVWISVLKDLQRLRRDPFSVAIWMGIPLCIGLLISLVFGGEGATPQGRLLIADQDNTIVSNMLTGAFSREPLAKMLLVERVDEETGRARINRGDGSAFLLIPKGLQEAVLRNKPFRMLLLTNPAQRIVPKIVEETLSIMTDGAFYVEQIAGSQLRSLATGGALSIETIDRSSLEILHMSRSLGNYLDPPLIQLETAVAVEKKAARPGVAAPFFPNMIFMALMMMANGLAGDIWKERASGTLRRLVATPATLRGFLGGRVIVVALVFCAVGFAGVAVARWLAGVQVSNFAAAVAWAALAGTAFYVLLLLVVLQASSERAAHVLGNLIVFPLALVGGSFFPFEMMPPWMANIGRFTPNGWTVLQFKAILSGSADPSHLGATLAGLLLLVPLAFLLCVRRLRGGFLV